MDDIRIVIDTYYPIERMMLRGVYEQETMRVIERFIHHSQTCVDVGVGLEGRVASAHQDEVGVAPDASG